MEPHAETREYMVSHQLPQLLETVLATVVPQRVKRPEEVIDRLVFVSHPHTPAATEKEAEERLSFDSRLDTLMFNLFEDMGPAAASDPDAAQSALAQMCVEVFERHDVCTTLRTDVITLRKWMCLVQVNYHAEVPFHNFWHAANVLQTLHAFLADSSVGGCGARELLGLTPLDTAAVLFAAVCHDLQHPGRDGSFLINTADPLALRYNDTAVLEQHHCATAFGVTAAAPAADILAGLRAGLTSLNVAAVGPSAAIVPPPPHGASYESADGYRDFRKTVVECILATEVASHTKHIVALKDVADAGYDKSNAEHRMVAMAALLEAADVSNESRAFGLSQVWASRVQSEFYAQGDIERQLGIAVPVMRDRGRSTLAAEQQGFIAFLARPLYEQLARLVPPLQQCIDSLDRNSHSWGQLEQ